MDLEAAGVPSSDISLVANKYVSEDYEHVGMTGRAGLLGGSSGGEVEARLHAHALFVGLHEATIVRDRFGTRFALAGGLGLLRTFDRGLFSMSLGMASFSQSVQGQGLDRAAHVGARLRLAGTYMRADLDFGFFQALAIRRDYETAPTSVGEVVQVGRQGVRTGVDLYFPLLRRPHLNFGPSLAGRFDMRPTGPYRWLAILGLRVAYAS
jgi:hypothetical protein